MNWIDNFLNKTTMYSLMLYFLVTIAVVGVAMAFLGYLPYSPWLMLLNIVVLYGTCKLTNIIFARLFKVQANWESSAITGLILALIVGPVTPITDIWKVVLIAIVAMLSKYVIVYDRRHLFNPAAIAVTISAYTIGFGASWWVGDIMLLPVVVIGGLLFLRKSRWFHLALSFLITYFLGQTALYLLDGITISAIPQSLLSAVLYSPILFFSFVMLTEPLTMPGTKRGRIFYGALIGAIMAVILPLLLNISYGFELSLLLGNIIALIVFGNTRRFMVLVSQQEVAENTKTFSFTPNRKLSFKPGQFLLWTLPHNKTDMRGHRRYFSIASAPSEEKIMIMTKFAEESSSFKKTLKALPTGSTVMTAGLDGEFILPEKTSQPLVFIAGGVGIAPFRSMIKDMLDKKIQRPITLLYSNNTTDEICFKDLFEEAGKDCGLKTVYTLTNIERLPKDWIGKTGYINEAVIKSEVANFEQASYYVSGPDPMVRAMKKTLLGMGISNRQIKTDYFTGYA